MENKPKKFDPILVACTVVGFLGVDKFYKKSYVWGAVKLIFSTGSFVLFLTSGPGIKVLFAITLFLAVLWWFLDLIFALAKSYELNPFKYFSGGDEEDEEDDIPLVKVPEPIVTTEAPMAPIKEEPPVMVPPVQEEPKVEAPPAVEEAPVEEPAPPVVEDKPEPVEEKPKPVEKEKPQKEAPRFDENTYHIEENKDEKNPNYKKWGIRKEGSNRTMKYFDTQKDAIDQAKTMAQNNNGSVVVHKREGGYRKV